MINERGRWGVLVAAFVAVFLIAPVVGGVAGATFQEDGGDGNETNASTDYTLEELRQLGPHKPGTPPSMRPSGEAGGYWVTHVPTGLMVSDTESNRVSAAPGETTIRRGYLYLNSFQGWDAPRQEVTVHLVAWKPGERERSGPNGTYTERVPVDVVHQTERVTFPAGTYGEAKVPIPESYDEAKYLTMWIEGKRSETQWVYTVKTSKAAQEIPLSTAGGLVVWGGWNIGVTFLLTAALTIVGDRYLLDKIGRGPGVSALEWAFFGLVAVFLGGFVYYDGVIDTLVSRPYLLGVLGGLAVGLLAITVFSDDGEEALFLQFRPQDARAGADGAGRLRVANQVHTVVGRAKDGRKAVPRTGWLPALARAWPWSDATPLLEFDVHKQRRIESPTRDVEMPDDAGIWERIRTRFVGSANDGDEYDVVYIVDPLADDVVQYQEETFELYSPDLLEWPDEDAEPERFVRGVPLPRVAWGTIGAGLFALGVVYAATAAFVGSSTWATLAVCVLGVAFFIRPVEGSAVVELAPAQFDVVVNSAMNLLEGYSERQDAEHFQEKWHRSEAKRRAKARAESEQKDETIFREIAEEMAPERAGDDVAEVSSDD
ncbi:hypothetical protein [Halobacterium wangiae]|uniref:hypothetical protein n=1 Tax=Halobacterium wangiae TaxID=2902623 RepID=UPI001E2E46C3|nr:hypothetical protein [Halobacterium wangiae]